MTATLTPFPGLPTGPSVTAIRQGDMPTTAQALADDVRYPHEALYQALVAELGATEAGRAWDEAGDIRDARRRAAAPRPILPQYDRLETIRRIRAGLRERSGKAWSVAGGTGTTWGYVTIRSTPARRDQDGGMTDADRAELADLLGLPAARVHRDGIWSYRNWAEFVARAQGEPTA